jgi:prolyl-tRNA editing enzyme YbaK/EbsC (Cys-tRNA(Pro) deacylase)
MTARTATPSPALSAGARKVEEAARALGLDIEVREMAASTRTAEEAASACGCSLAQIVKSLVFIGSASGQPCLVLVSGANRLDEARAPALFGEALRRAQADEVRALTGYAIGGVPPFGHATRLRAFMDEDLFGFDTIWAAGGTPRSMFAITPHALAAATGAGRVRVK